MRTRPRRRTTRIGPIRVNRTGLRINSVTANILPWTTVVLWERAR